jgi:CIC family chloride channel protein
MRFPVTTTIQHLPPQTRTILLTCLYGLGGGAAAVAFLLAMNALYRNTLIRLTSHPPVTFVIGSFVVIVSTSLGAGFLLNSFCKEAAGSGIPQVKLAFWKEFGAVPWRTAWVKFLGGILSVGGGSSLGREGPSVQIAAGLASSLAQVLGEPKQSRRRAAAAGSAAGLAAAFNTPLAAVTFVLEEIIEDLNSRLLGSVLLAAVIGALLVHGLIGRQPAFTLLETDAPTWRAYLLTPAVAAFAALTGVVFQYGTLKLRLRQRRLSRIPGWIQPAMGAVCAWVLGVAVFLYCGRLGVFGLGYEDLSDALNHNLPWTIAGLLLASKLAATIVCYGFGGAGGIFSPTLCFGGMSGVFMAGLAGWGMHLTHADHMTLAVVGMSACLGAVVRAPITGILIVFEMTHEFSLLPALMIGALVSQAVARRLTESNFYEAILRQDGHRLDIVIPPRDLQGWRQLPVSAIATFQPVAASDLSLAAVRDLLQSHPFERFPVLADGQVVGLLTRKEAQAALAEEREPRLDAPVTCLPTHSVGELQKLLLDSASFLVCVLDQPKGRLLAVVTLHDLLRAEMRYARRMD